VASETHCHRCHKPIDGYGVLYPFRFIVRRGDALRANWLKYYHQKCLPPLAYRVWLNAQPLEENHRDVGSSGGLTLGPVIPYFGRHFGPSAPSSNGT
jgi:hypothetical protein